MELQESRTLLNLESVRALCLSVLMLVGCGDQAPTIRMLEYTPNAGFINASTEIDGSFLFSDSNQDASQWVVELVGPDDMLVFRSPPTPGEDVSMGITGMATFSFTWTPSQTGIFRFAVWLVDLTARESNHLTGDIRIATMDPYGPGNP